MSFQPEDGRDNFACMHDDGLSAGFVATKLSFSPGSGVIPVGVPPGLEKLLDLSFMRIHEHNKFIERFPWIFRGRRYSVLDQVGRTCYIVGPEEPFCCQEECCGCARCCPGDCAGCSCKQCTSCSCQQCTSCSCKQCTNCSCTECTRCGCCSSCCYEERDFNMYALNETRGSLLMNAYHEFSCCEAMCCSCRLPCSGENIFLNVEAPIGTSIRRIRFHMPCCGMDKFFLEDLQGNTQLILKHECCKCRLCDSKLMRMDILASNEADKVGEIKKDDPGCYKKCCFRSSEFEVTFPQDLDVKVKALLMISPFFIDWIYYTKRLLEIPINSGV